MITVPLQLSLHLYSLMRGKDVCLAQFVKYFPWHHSMIRCQQLSISISFLAGGMLIIHSVYVWNRPNFKGSHNVIALQSFLYVLDICHLDVILLGGLCDHCLLRDGVSQIDVIAKDKHAIRSVICGQLPSHPIRTGALALSVPVLHEY